MKPQQFFSILGYLGLAGAVLLLGHYHMAALAALLIIAPSVYTWLRAGRSNQALISVIPELLVGLSVIMLIGLSKPPFAQSVFPVATQVVLAALFGTWMIWYRLIHSENRQPAYILALQQTLVTTALFLAAAFWHWPPILVIALMWATSFISAWWYLQLAEERAASILASAWALIVAELSWVLLLWEVNYIIPKQSGYIIIPQATIVILGLGYCFASVYESHSQKRLSRRRLIEYVAIAGVLLAIIIAGTRWNGTV